MNCFMCLLNRARSSYGLPALIILAISAATIVTMQNVYGHEQDVQKLNRFVQASRTNTPAMKMFREGRDFIEKENWQQAAERFQGFINGFPKERNIDAALYWYAYALQKLEKKDDAATPLLRLIKEFPSSSWRREAEAMLVVLGRRDALQQALTDQSNCEIKILALQSLFQADEDRAISFVTDVLKTSPESCPGLKAAAVSLAGSHGGPRVVPLLVQIARGQADMKLRLTAIRKLGEQKSDTVADELLKLYEADSTKEIRQQILRALADMENPRAEAKLIEVARSGGDLTMRLLAIRFLGDQPSAATLDELLRIFDADKTPEIRTEILRALSDRNDPRARAKLLEIARRGETPDLRVAAIRRLADHRNLAVDDLLTLYSTETDPAIKQGLIRAYGDMSDPRARAKLFEIGRTDASPELRIYAIRMLGNRNDSETVDQLIAMYDTTNDVKVKTMLLRAFGDSSQKNAVRKLMAIARSSDSVDLRKMAVRMLGESKDPEVLKFLEELLK